MSDQSQFVALRCEACGGKLDVPKQYTVDVGDGIFTITGDNIFTCQHCDTEYLPKQSLERFATGGSVIISNIIGGTISIGNIIASDVPGDVVGGDVVTGDKVMGDTIIGDKIVVVTSNKANPQDNEKRAVNKQKAQPDIVTSNKADLEDREKETVKKNLNNVTLEPAKKPSAEPGKMERWFNTIGRWFRIM